MSGQVLTQDKVKELFDYDKDTGILIRKVTVNNRAKAGQVAGTSTKTGRLYISINRKKYANHRLAWLYHYGYFPETGIDHINRNPADNRISNLRAVSNQCNLRNTGNPRHNTSGVKGVRWYKGRQEGWRGSWGANIQVNNKSINLGSYPTLLEAVCHRLAAEQAENWNGCDSSSPAFKYVSEHITPLV